MKKLLVLFGIIALTPALCFAYLEEDKTSDVDTLRGQGYSENMLRAVDTVNYHNKGVNSDYKRRFTPKRPRGLRAGNAWTKIKLYTDPIQDDGLFGEHQINFTNTWTGEETSYSMMLKENKKVEDL